MEHDAGSEFAPMAATTEAKALQLLAIREKYRGDTCTNQCTRLLEALRLWPVSTFEARRYLDVMHPAGRVRELKRDHGFKIDTLRRRQLSDIGRLHSIGVYVLVTEANEAREVTP